MVITKQTIDKVFKAKKSSVESMENQGYTLVKEFFVDSSGFGEVGESALTVSQFLQEVENLLTEYKKLTAKITDSGQFQVYVGLFQKQ